MVKHIFKKNKFTGRMIDYFKNESDLEKLINILKGIESGRIKVGTKNGVINKIYGNDKDIAITWILAEELLIRPDGQCDWDNIDRLEQEGFDVFPEKSDSFGWLAGCIKTERGVLIYG